VFETVVVSTEGSDVAGDGWSAIGVSLPMVEVGPSCRHATAGKNAGGVAGFDISALFGAGSTARDPVPQHRASVRVRDRYAPLTSRLAFDCLAGDICDDRSPPLNFGRGVVETNKGGEIDPDINCPSCHCRPADLAAFQQVQIDIGPALIDGPLVAIEAGGAGETVDLIEDGGSPVGREIASDQVSGAIGVGLGHHSPIGETMVITPLGVGRVDLDT
jgi:hypothetical protein